MLAFYIICSLIALLILMSVVISEGFANQNQVVLGALVLIANVGYLALAGASNVSEAILATKLTYVGGMLGPFFLFRVISDLCGFRFRKRIAFSLFGVQMALYLVICLIGYNDWYYKDIVFHRTNGIGYLEKSYGPIHNLYLVSIFGYALATLVVALISIRRKNKISTRNILFLLFTMVFAVIVSRLEKIVGYEIMPMIYIIFEIGVYLIIYKINIFSVEHNAGFDHREMEGVGYVMLNAKLRYMGCNEYMKQIIPEVTGFYLEAPIPSDNILAERVIPQGQLALEKGGAIQVPAQGQLALEKAAALQAPMHGQKEKNGQNQITIGNRIFQFRLQPLYTMHQHLYAYRLRMEDVTERQKYLDMIHDYNRNLEQEVKGKTQRIREIQQKTLLGMAQMVESRDLSTGGHIKRTSLVVSVFSKALLKTDLGFNEAFLQYVERSAPMHDLGKIAVDDQILRKQGKFTPEEYEEMKKHSAAGAKIVTDILSGIEEEEFVRIAANVAHYHHEKMNGMGYPEGLKGEEIPVEARIMALADVFDALVSKRCYKEAFSYEHAFQIITEESGTHFDEALAQVFISCRTELEALYNSFME